MANKLVQENKTHKSLKLRIYPNQEQTILINKTLQFPFTFGSL